MGKRCVVTGCLNNSRHYSMFSFPNPLKQNYREPRTYDLAVKRREAWIKAINRPTFNLSQEKCQICSIHFSSGRPAKLVDKNNVDWIPTLFMNGLDNDQIPKKRDSKQNPSPSDTDPPLKQPRIALTNSNQEKEPPATPVIEEPVKRKVIYSRPVQPVNGVWPRLTATIITPESINSPCNSLLLSNLGVEKKSVEIVESVLEEKSQSIAGKDTSTADAEDSLPDCDVSAAYCFTSKLKEEKATQVTADEIRLAFQSTASTQTLWK
ncbi:uncharacterized protein LOC124200348 isoform X2 [Daphnia pulex]|uniref:uncharacterized protein LOC124200348 isoform X2 n=1 Tax=Daphnia pulex TaxID=6669 RepID=UPI001EDF338A|nr:uncharacterized protein LOC124200348 isoform X2 [Daphnia pulex]